MPDSLRITLSDPVQIANFENALEAVEAELETDVHRSRGRPPDDAISVPEAVDEMATAYAGIDLREVEHVD